MEALSPDEKDILNVVKKGIEDVRSVASLEQTNMELENNISSSEELLRSIGHGNKLSQITSVSNNHSTRTVEIKTFEDLLLEANKKHPKEVCFEDILSTQEIKDCSTRIEQLNIDFDGNHKLDKVDILIPVVAGIFSGALDCALGGFTKDAAGRNIPGTMSEFVCESFNRVLTPDRIIKLENISKVPYDALNHDNKGNIIVREIVDGLSPVFHHLASLGHDPILGFIFGVCDILNGTVTTLDFKGKVVIQAAEGFSDRKAQDMFQAIATVFLHLLSDVNGSSSAKNGGMGLPVPFMALFNKMQFEKIGDNDTISDLVKSMFYQGYDFRHFCSMSIPVMITEVVVRVAYFAKRLYEGHSFEESIPVGNHINKPRLSTMLFTAHSASTAINAGKVAFKKNPLDINYAQWLAFANYSLRQFKWTMIEKPNLRHRYVMDAIDEQWKSLYDDLDDLWCEYSSGGGTV